MRPDTYVCLAFPSLSITHVSLHLMPASLHLQGPRIPSAPSAAMLAAAGARTPAPVSARQGGAGLGHEAGHSATAQGAAGEGAAGGARQGGADQGHEAGHSAIAQGASGPSHAAGQGAAGQTQGGLGLHKQGEHQQGRPVPKRRTAEEERAAKAARQRILEATWQTEVGG